MTVSAEPVFLLKSGELFIKGSNRSWFEGVLVANVRAVLPSAIVRNLGGKYSVEGEGHDPAAIERLCKVFGVVAIEVGWRLRTDPEAIERTALEVARDAVDRSGGALRSFRITASRSWKGYPARSPDVNRDIGSAVNVATGLSVDLGRPDLEIRIEIGDQSTFVSSRRLPGAGGLPLGCSGRAVLLLSGGIDSPVAGWLAMRRGLLVDALHFHSPPHTGPASLRKVEDLAGLLASWQGKVMLHLVPFTKAQEAVRSCVREDYRVLLYRRLMMRIASRIAGLSGAGAIITGESLGQVASQTLENLRCVEATAALPVLRPLVTCDKSEIISRARSLGSYEISIRPGTDCCSLFVPRHPVTKGRLDACERAESRLDVEALVEEAVSGTTTS